MIDTRVSLDLMEFIEKQILPRYASFDKAHNLSHANSVIRRSIALAQRLGANVDMAYAIAAYHDLGLSGPRAIHIVAEADRDLEPESVFLRTIQYGLDHYPEKSREEHWQRFCQHMQEKYSANGYIKLWLPNSPNAESLQEIRRIIAQPDQLRQVFERLFPDS